MPEHPEHSQNTHKLARTFLDKLASFISSEPDTRTELLEILQDAHERKLIDSECLSMIEGVFRLFDSAVRDVMVPRSRMYVIDITRPLAEWIGDVQENGHSRYPAIEGDGEKIVGILHAKDLLHIGNEQYVTRDILHPAIFIPESKRLNVLLRDFRNNHNRFRQSECLAFVCQTSKYHSRYICFLYLYHFSVVSLLRFHRLYSLGRLLL